MHNLTGKSLGRYRVLERIGRGGMAEVYRAYQPSLDRDVAVKVLHPFLLEEAGARERFQREARAVAALRHPNIVQVFDYDNDGDVYFMVMEFIDGPNLKAVLQEHAAAGTRLEPARVAEIMAGIGGALAYAHRQGMIHRDVKPQNIMFTREGQPLLTDFGIAKIVSGSAASASGSLSGTPAYMSPEQGRSLPLDNRTDIYSLGVVLYEMVTGRVPFDADTPLAIVVKHINDPLPLPRTVDPGISPALERVILKAMAKAPEERFATADDMARAVQDAVADTRTTQPLPGPAVPAPPAVPDAPPISVPTIPATGDVASPVSIPPPAPPGDPAPPEATAPPGPPAAPPQTTITARLASSRLSCTMAVSVLAVLVLIVGGLGYMGLTTGSSRGEQVAGALPPPSATVPLLAAGAPPPTTPPAASLGDPLPAATPTDAADTTATASPAPGSVQDGDRRLLVGQYAQALAVYNGILAADPQDEAALLGQARAYLGLYQWSDAQATANALLARDPTLLPALLIRAHATALLGDSAAADADWQAAFAAHPDDPAIYQARGESYLHQDRPDLALADFQHALTPDSTNTSLWIDLGRAYSSGGANQPDKALDAFAHALQLDPGNPAALSETARVDLDYTGDAAQARAAIDQALASGPPTAAMYYLRARSDRGLGDEPGELADLGRAVAVEPANPDPYEWRSDYYFRHRQWDAAVADAGHWVDLSNGSQAAYLWRSRLLLLAGNDADATADAQQAISQAPDAADGYMALAQVLYVQGNYAAALDPADKAVARRQADNAADTVALRARIYIRLGRLADAAADQTSVPAAQANNPNLLLAGADLAAARNQVDTALALLDQWALAEGDYGAGFLLRAQIEAARGNTAPARQALAQAQQRALFPDERQAAADLLKKLGTGP